MRLLPLVLIIAAAPAAVAAQQIAPSADQASPPASAPPAAVPPSDPQAASPAATAAARYPGRPDLAALLGLTLVQAFASFGPPEEVLPLRGAQPWQDDVVFYYPDHTYLFWYQDRVWQVRVDRRYSGPVLGVAIGDTTAEVEQALGPPFHVDDTSLVFLLPDQGFPVRARLFFESDRLVDVYVYRGDF